MGRCGKEKSASRVCEYGLTEHTPGLCLTWLSYLSISLSLHLSMPWLCVCHGYHISYLVVHWRANAGLLLSCPTISLSLA